jgi:hypothetical protein
VKSLFYQVSKQHPMKITLTNRSLGFSILLILFLQQTTVTFGQNVCIDFFPIGDITGIEEDSAFLWLGSLKSGLIRFEKSTNNTQYFDTTNSNLRNQTIQSTLYHNGKLYLSTANSLLTFENNGFTMINDTLNGLLLEDANGDLAVIDSREMHILQNDNIIYHQNFDSISGMTIDCCNFSTDAIIDTSGNLWITRYAFYEFNILKFDGSTWQNFNSQNTNLPIESYQHNGIAHIGNIIYSTTWGSIHKYEQGTWNTVFTTNDFVNGTDTLNQYSSPTAIDVDPTGMLWIGTSNDYFGNESGQVLYFNDNQWHFLPIIDTIPSVVKKIHFSSQNPNIVYVASTKGLVTINRSCLSVSNEKLTVSAPRLLKVYPNPATEQVVIEWHHSIKKGQIVITDMLGKVILKKELNESGNTLDVNNWTKGTYVISVVSGNVRATQKVIVF